MYVSIYGKYIHTCIHRYIHIVKVVRVLVVVMVTLNAHWLHLRRLSLTYQYGVFGQVS